MSDSAAVPRGATPPSDRPARPTAGSRRIATEPAAVPPAVMARALRIWRGAAAAVLVVLGVALLWTWTHNFGTTQAAASARAQDAAAAAGLPVPDP